VQHRIRTLHHALLAGGTVLSSTLLIPAVRPFMGDHHGAPEAAFHAFMTVNLVGGAIGAPLVARWSERLRSPGRLLTTLCLLDGLLLLACMAPLPVGAILTLRTVQGAANLGGLSLIMGAATRGTTGTGRALGGVGAAVMVGVAAGSPLGTLALGLGPWGPVMVGGAIQLAVAAGTIFLPRWEPKRRTTERLRASRLPALWVGVERFGVGALVVSFAIYAREVHGLSDIDVGIAFAWFMVPFVAAVYPATRVASGPWRLRASLLGLSTYGLALGSIGVVPPGWIPVSMACCGMASAFVYGASLRGCADGVDPTRRARAMAALNAAGGVGMLLGTAGAGIVSTFWRRAGGDAAVVFPAIFAGAGLLQWGAALLSRVKRQPTAPRAEVVEAAALP